MFTALCLAAASPLAAQETFFGWHSDLAKAAEIAAEADKPIFAVFRCVR